MFWDNFNYALNACVYYLLFQSATLAASSALIPTTVMVLLESMYVSLWSSKLEFKTSSSKHCTFKFNLLLALCVSSFISIQYFVINLND